QNIRQAGPQGDASRARRLPSRSPPRARATRRSRCERSLHHGIEKRTVARPRRRVERENGGFLRAQFCTEVARPKRFELLTPRFVVWCSTLSRRYIALHFDPFPIAFQAFVLHIALRSTTLLSPRLPSIFSA